VTIEIKRPTSELPKCNLKVVDDHLEADCSCKAESDALAELLAKEVIIRIKPSVVTEGK
jgi:hypothetical protein